MLAVFRQRTADLPAGADFVMVADRIADPGNAGTIIRSAEAGGAGNRPDPRFGRSLQPEGGEGDRGLPVPAPCTDV